MNEIERLEEKLFYLKREEAEKTMATIGRAAINMNTIDMSADQPRTKPQVMCEIDRLNEAAKALNEITEMLSVKLAGVTSPTPVDERNTASVQMNNRVPLAATLYMIAEDLSLTARRLRQMYEAIEI